MSGIPSELPAIPARRSRLGKELIYRTLVLPACWRMFHRVWLKVEGPLPHPADGPLVVTMNHPSWWDGYMAFLLDKRVFRERFESYIMMEERQLRAYRFFTLCGAFSVERRRPGEAERSIAYISRLLRERRNRILWILPQGRITPNDQRPITVYPGAARVALRVNGALLWPVALRYEFRGEQQPEAFIRAGPPHRPSPEDDERSLTAAIQARLTAAVDALRDEVNGERLEGYSALLEGRPGINRVFDRLLAITRLGRGD
ncbi:MAG: lysophospholipid acyltransferase family protein [Chloroflexota bacterium]|nr:MAG: glycerol acyltransferase [Chloroflexota bacterium]